MGFRQNISISDVTCLGKHEFCSIIPVFPEVLCYRGGKVTIVKFLYWTTYMLRILMEYNVFLSTVYLWFKVKWPQKLCGNSSKSIAKLSWDSKFYLHSTKMWALLHIIYLVFHYRNIQSYFISNSNKNRWKICKLLWY